MNKTNDTIVIVESPAKASTIEKYLGPGYKVLASYGHVRDLLNKSGSVDPDHDFSMIWALSEKSQKPLDQILKAIEPGKELFLATDPDREGEAIAWHISQIIEDHYGENKIPIHRVVFHEITKNAVLEAIKSPHDIDNLLVDAYLARRALDYLVGYSLSPILWTKLPGSRSAGRVQSVALRLIVEREQDIEKFNSQEYWTIDGVFHNKASQAFSAKLIVFNQNKLSKLDIHTSEQADEMRNVLQALKYIVTSVEKKVVKRNPTPPFTTSTLQQEASRKLGFGASRTMRIAQKLYEGIQISGEVTGLITYMRTDSTNLSTEAVSNMRQFILQTYGEAYLPESPRIYKTKSKNAQEAHEAIRPTDVLKKPEDMAHFLDDEQRALYELIWKRAVASQMENAVYDQVTADVSDQLQHYIFRVVGTTQTFDGYLKLYQEGVDSGAETDHENLLLPKLQKDEPVELKDIIPTQHFTQPPPRFTEASLVKKLEELGIGRPSTYAPLMQVLQDRQYVTLEKKQFIPSDRGRIVTVFLTNFCKKYVEYDFTAQMEEELDDIANGKCEWKSVMHEFWSDFSTAVEQMKTIRISEVIDKLEENLSAYLFPHPEDRQCNLCHDGVIGLKLSKFGAFLGCSNYPECKNRKYIGASAEDVQAFEPVDLGIDPIDHAKLSLHKGPYGFYIQADLDPSYLPSSSKRKKNDLIKRTGIPAGVDPLTITLDFALELKRLPKELGMFEEHSVQLNIGRFGPYIKCGTVLASIPKSINFLKISLDEAIELIKKKREKPSRVKKTKKTSKKAK